MTGGCGEPECEEVLVEADDTLAVIGSKVLLDDVAEAVCRLDVL